MVLSFVPLSLCCDLVGPVYLGPDKQGSYFPAKPLLSSSGNPQLFFFFLDPYLPPSSPAASPVFPPNKGKDDTESFHGD